MKKYIALMLAGLMLALTMTACSSGESEEVPEETAAPETVPAETEDETEVPETEEEAEPENKPERPEVEVIDYITLELEKDVIYDRAAGLFVMYFTDHELLYPEDAGCSVGLISTEEAFSIKGTPDFAAYPDVKIDEDDYCGIAIKLAEEIPAGDYMASVTFDHYIVSFDFTAN